MNVVREDSSIDGRNVTGGGEKRPVASIPMGKRKVFKLTMPNTARRIQLCKAYRSINRRIS